MDRREFLLRAGRLIGGGAVVGGAFSARAEGAEAANTYVRKSADRQAPSRLRLPATLQSRAFAESFGDDGRYHALVYEGGGAAAKSLLTTPVSDGEAAVRLREMGAEDGGGVPMAAWNLRNWPLVPWPDSRVEGTPVRILVEWDGWDRPRELGELLRDPGGEGVVFRFGGNEEHDDAWESGCVVCLYSCPGGVISNERYSIRDRVQGATDFTPVEGLPPDGTRMNVVLELL